MGLVDVCGGGLDGGRRLDLCQVPDTAEICDLGSQVPVSFNPVWEAADVLLVTVTPPALCRGLDRLLVKQTGWQITACPKVARAVLPQQTGICRAADNERLYVRL